MFPLDFLTDSVPEWFGVARWWFQPLKFLAYFPAAVYLGKITGPELWQGLLLQAAWVVFFFFAAATRCSAATALQRVWRMRTTNQIVRFRK